MNPPAPVAYVTDRYVRLIAAATCALCCRCAPSSTVEQRILNPLVGWFESPGAHYISRGTLGQGAPPRASGGTLKLRGACDEVQDVVHTKAVRRTVVLSGLAIALAACSSGPSATSTTTSPTASTSTTISTATAASAYLADVAPANAALTAFSGATSRWNSSTTNAQGEMDAQPVIAALQNLDTALTSYQWPTDAVADVHTMIGDNGALIGDLQSIANLTLVNDSGWLSTLQRDAAADHSAVNLVRHDLGLPPQTTSG